MRVTFVVDGMRIGGIERVCVDYTNLFLKLGYDVTLINLNPHFKEMELELSSKVHVKHIYFPRKLAPEQYTQIIKKNLFCKIIYPFIYILLLIVNYFYLCLCKLIFAECRQKNEIAISFSSHFNDLTFVSEKFVNAKHTMAWVHGALYGYLLISDGYINLYNKIKNLIVLVDDAQKEVEITNKQLKVKINKLYNPSNIKKKSINYNVVNGLRKKYGNFLLMVSRFEYPHKDQFTVVKAFEILRQKYNLSLDLVFLGDGPNFKDVEKEVNKLKPEIGKHIHLLGSKMDVQNYYVAAKLLVHASVAGEGLPTIMIEAMNYNLPEVVTDSKVGPREILGDNKYGLLCKVENPKDMAEKINKLIVNKDLYKKYQNKENERVTDFSPQVIERKLEKILYRIIAS